MTYMKLAAWVTTFSVICGAIGLSLNTRCGYFSNDQGFMVYLSQGALGFKLATGDGCWPNGIVASIQPIASYSGLFSLPFLSLSDTGVSFQIPGIIWLLSLSLVCFSLYLRARHYRSH